MSQENFEIIRRGLDYFNRRDKDGWVADCDPEIENFPPREWPESSPLRGPEAIWNFFVAAQESWLHGSFEWGEPTDAGADKVVAKIHQTVRGKTSGAVIDFDYWVVTTFRKRRVLRFEWFSDRSEALGAARAGD